MATKHHHTAPHPTSSLARRRQRLLHVPSSARPAARPTSHLTARASTSVRALRTVDPRTFIGLGLAVLAVVLLVRSVILSRQAVIAASPAPSSSPASQNPAPEVGHPAPTATFRDASDHPVTLASFQGSVVVLNFWYAACDPCRIEMPALERTYQAQHANGLVVLGADTSDDAQTMMDFARQLGITYPVVRDPAAHTAIAFGVIGTPTSFILDRHGIIRYRITGPVDHDTLVKDVSTLLARS